MGNFEDHDPQDQESFDPASLVERFAEVDSPEDYLPESQAHLTTQLCYEVKILFRSILGRLEQCDTSTKSQITSLQRSYSHLVLWIDTFSHVSINTNDVLVTPDLQATILGYVRSIGSILIERLIPRAFQYPAIPSKELDLQIGRLESCLERANVVNDGASDFSDDFDADSYAEISEDLKTNIHCLIQLNTILMSSGPDVGAPLHESVDSTTQRVPYQPYYHRINEKFPGVADWLLTRLAKANLDRYLRCLRHRPETWSDHEDKPQDKPEAATGLVSVARDSGIGSSVPTQPRYAKTVMSYTSGADGGSGRVPPLGAAAKRGVPFECLACAKPVVITDNTAWKRHLYADLCPWQCLEATCTSGDEVFTKRDAWIEHLATQHALGHAWLSFRCPLCKNDTGSGEMPITRHLEAHLEEISLAVLPADLEWESDPEGNDSDEISFKKPPLSMPTAKENSYDEGDVSVHGIIESRPRKARTSKSKVKTGCNRCKQRRTRCDKRRPACTSCVRSGNECKGYPPPLQTNPFGEARIAPRPASDTAPVPTTKST